jgi:iron complex outermembrane receptor protein
VEPATPFTEAIPPPSHEVFPFVNRNGLAGTTSGFEIVPNWKPREWWRVQASYSYLHMDLRTKPGSLDTTTVNSTEGSSPQHQVVVQSFFDLPGRIEFSQAYRYVSALPAQTVANYQTVDARFAWRATRQIEFSLAGQNLLQPHHTEYGGNPGGNVGIRRGIYLAVTCRR